MEKQGSYRQMKATLEGEGIEAQSCNWALFVRNSMFPEAL